MPNSTPKLFPQRTKAHITGDQAVRALRNCLPTTWICREVATDYGIDCEIEIVADSGTVTGAILKAQVKGTAIRRSEPAAVSVTTRQVRHWLALPVPVILVHVDLTQMQVSWIDVREYLLETDRLDTIYTTSLRTLRFSLAEARHLPETASTLAALAQQHQEKVKSLFADALSQLAGDFIGYLVLVEVFEGDPDKWIGWLRHKGSLDQLLTDLPLAVWVKHQAARDPEFLNRVKLMVADIRSRNG